MYMLTQTDRLENSKNNVYLVKAPEIEQQYMDAGYNRHERTYQLKEQHKEYNVICPEFRNDKTGAEPVVIIPEFLVPGRPYPVYVYLFAIDLYSRSPDRGQRWAAEETRRCFGLETFAHTTLGRALKRLVKIIGEAAEAMCETKGDGKASSFPTVNESNALRKKAARFLRGRLAWGKRQQGIDMCIVVVMKWYKKTGRLLL